MQRDTRAAERERLAVLVRLQQGFRPEAPGQDGQAVALGVVQPAAGACMVAMAVRDHRARHGPPRIDVEVAGRAIQPFRTQLDEIGRKTHGTRVSGGASTWRQDWRSDVAVRETVVTV